MLISFINSQGKKFTIHKDYVLSPRWAGFGDLFIENKFKKAPYQKGSTYIDTVFKERVSTLEFTILADSRQKIFERRFTIIKDFNPELGLGILEWEQEDGTKYQIELIPSDIIFADGDGQGPTHQEVIIQFQAPYPFWYSPELLEQYFIGFSGGLSIPFSFPWTFGEIGTEVELIYNGNTNAPVLIYMNGEVVNPEIKNLTTGKTIKINTTIPDGSILVINTKFGKKSVRIDGENAFQYVAPESEFWELIPGINKIKYTATSEGVNAKCKLTYYEWFTGR